MPPSARNMVGMAGNNKIHGASVGARTSLSARFRNGGNAWTNLRAFRAVLVLAIFFTGAFVSFGQTLRSQSEDGARQVIQTYDPPNENQVKTDITSRHYDRANGHIVYQDAKINQYPVTGGAPDMTAETPGCESDYQFNEFTSTNRLKASAGKGNFLLEGTGFSFSRTNNNLIVSNDVRSILKLRTATNSAL